MVKSPGEGELTLGAGRDVLASVTAAGTGAAVGATAIDLAGLSAAGMVGSGTGIGAAAGPVGAVFGAVTGLAVYGLVVTVRSVGKEPRVRETTRKARQRFGCWIAGDALGRGESRVVTRDEVLWCALAPDVIPIQAVD